MIYQPLFEQSDWSECYNHGRRLTLGACTLGTIADHHSCSTTQLTGELLMDTADGARGFFSTLSLRLRICTLTCHAMYILVVL